MKKLFLLVLSYIIIISCSSGNDEPSDPSNVQTSIIPAEFKGDWNVDYFTSEDGNWISSSPGHFYLKFKPDNTIELKDVNGTFSGTSKYIWGNFTVTTPNNIRIYINTNNSTTHTGYKTFSIHYENAPSYFEQRFYDAKKQ